MNIFLHELKEKTSIEYTFDYQQKIGSVVDILSIEPAKVKGDVIFNQGELNLDLTVDVNMELACSKTLKPVFYHLTFDAYIVFGDGEDADFPLSDPIEISDIIFGYIVSEKPYTIYHPDADQTTFEKERSPHPAFADLDKTFKT